MTVKELIEKLKQYDENLEVVVEYRDSGGSYNELDDEILLDIRKQAYYIHHKHIKENLYEPEYLIKDCLVL